MSARGLPKPVAIRAKVLSPSQAEILSQEPKRLPFFQSSFDILQSAVLLSFANEKTVRPAEKKNCHSRLLFLVRGSGPCLPSGLGEGPRADLWAHGLCRRSGTGRLHG